MSSEKRKENRKNRFFKVINSDRYQYTESSIYLKNNMEDKIAVFDIFIRTKNKNDFGIVSGIDEVIELIDILNETSSKERKKYLEKILDDRELIEYISFMKFKGDIKGVRNGEIVFTNEPVMTITAPLIQAKILETPILNILNHHILATTAAAKIVMEAKNKAVLFFGTRRNAGFEAAMATTKAAYIVGCSGHANIMGEYKYGWKSTGTMTHSYIQTFGMTKEGEYRAFDLFIKENRGKKAPLVMLIDTYDTLEIGIKNAIKAFSNNNINDAYEGIYGIRIDSGKLSEYADVCRKELEKQGFTKAKIILTGGLDKNKIRKMIKNNTQVDIFGVGDAMCLPENTLSLVYKMCRVDRQDVMKLSNNNVKISYPGNKDIYRIENENEFKDYIELEENNKDAGNKKKSIIKENRRKLTIEYIKNGEKNIENCELLSLENSRSFFLKNKKYLEKLYHNKEINRVFFSEAIEELKEKLIKNVKE